jgi:hypothetical protein
VVEVQPKPSAASRLRFESAQSEQTLAQGLAEYFAANPSLKRDSTLQSSQARKFFRSHDVVLHEAAAGQYAVGAGLGAVLDRAYAVALCPTAASLAVVRVRAVPGDAVA